MPTKSFTYDGTPYSMYSRSDFSDDQAFNSLEGYINSGKQSFNPQDEKSIMVSPGNVSSLGDMASHVRSIYDQYIAGPMSKGIQGIQSNPTVQGMVGPGFTPPTGVNTQTPTGGVDTQFNPVENKQGINALGDYVRNTINDPVATMLMFAGGPLGKATGTVMQKVAPVVLQGTLKALGLPIGLATGTLALDQLFDPNASIQDSTKKALTVGGVTTALQYAMTGWNKMLSSASMQQATQQDTLAQESLHNDMLEGFNKVWSKYEVSGSIEKNPALFIKEISSVAQDVGQKKLNTSIQDMLNYVKLNAGDDVKREFAGNISSLRSNLTKLSSLEESSGKYNEIFKSFLDDLHNTQNIVYGIRGKGYGITNPSDTVLSYQLSQDPQFIKALVSSKAITQNQAGSIMKNKGLEQVMPDWKDYVTQADVDRVVGRSNANANSMANSRNFQSQKDLNLPAWSQNMQSLVQEVNNINRSKAVTESIVNVGDLKDVQSIRKAALETLQKYDKVDAMSQQLVTLAGQRGSRLQQELQGRTLASTQRYMSKDYKDLTGTQLSLVGPINSAVLKSLKDRE